MNLRQQTILLAVGWSLALAGCGGPTKRAEALIEAKSESTVTGSIIFLVDGSLVTAKINIAGAPPGVHGMHLHEKGDCSAADAMSAGGHWNPRRATHGNFAAEMHHAGDLGNIEIGADGKGSVERQTTEWTVGAATSTAGDVINRAVIFHEKTDDFSQPVGNAGKRLGCGVVHLAQ